jgi:hypothetical protein
MGEVGRSGRGGWGPLGDLFRQLADRIALLRPNCSRGLGLTTRLLLSKKAINLAPNGGRT